MGSSLN